jgi:DNA mismatch repair protein MSH2
LDATVPRARFAVGDLEQDVRRLVGDASAAAALSVVAERKLAGSALAALIRGERLTGGEDAVGCCTLVAHTLRDTMRLDNAAVKALTLLPPSRSGISRSASGAADSVLSLFRGHALSSGGGKLLRRWLLQPLLDPRRIRMRQGAVSAILSDAELRDSLRDALRVPDLQALARRLHRGSASLLDVCRLYQAITALPGLASLLEEPAKRSEEEEEEGGGAFGAAAAAAAAAAGSASASSQEQVGDATDGVSSTQASSVAAPPSSSASSGASSAVARSLLGRLHARVLWCCKELEQFEAMVDKVILDPTDPEPRINPAWDDSLGEAAAAIEEAQADMQEALSAAQRTWGRSIGVKLEKDKTRGLLFRCLRKHDREVRTVPGVQIVSVLKDGVRFTTTTGGRSGGGLRGIAQAMRAAEIDYQDKQKEIVGTAVEVVRTYCPVIEAASAALSELDAVRAMACTAASAPLQYVRPELVPLSLDADGRPSAVAKVEILGARHPVLEAQAAAGEAPEAVVAVGGGSGFVPNDYILGGAPSSGATAGDGSDAPSPGLLHIVTGPNMGGKSTYIRTLGTIAVMAQAGSFVPADRAVIPIFDSVQARVGAGDAQVRGVSTFMAEMLEAAAILETATPASLVIVDELGRGTSTYDGFGLAWAIAERLASSTRCVTLFATHFHELTALEDSATVPPGSVRNRHVTAAVGAQPGGSSSSSGVPARALTMLYRVRAGPCPASFGVHVAEIAGFPKSLVDAARTKAAELEALAHRGRQILTETTAAGSAASASASSSGKVASAPVGSQAARVLAESLAAAGSAGDREAVLAAAKEALSVYAAAAADSKQ